MKTADEKKARLEVERAKSWEAYQAEQKRVDDNMARLRAERLKREALPDTQGEKTKPKRPGQSSKAQTTADRP
jgi:hypothetical protein